MSRLSTVAVSTLVPALKVLSTTLPDSTFFSLVRTNAPPLPGLTCWNSDDGPELAVEVENQAVLQVVRRCHGWGSLSSRRCDAATGAAAPLREGMGIWQTYRAGPGAL